MSSTEEIYKKKQKFDSAELIERLSVIMEKDEIFKDVSLTIEGLAEMLHTNRTYLSKAVNENFQMSFRQWLNTYRIEQSIRFMMQHPAANQEEIARNSGFLSASAFNHRFKEVTGTSPRLWLVEKSVGVR